MASQAAQVKATALTFINLKDLPASKAFRTLRQERTNARLVGKRAKKAKEAAEKAEKEAGKPKAEE